MRFDSVPKSTLPLDNPSILHAKTIDHSFSYPSTFRPLQTFLRPSNPILTFDSSFLHLVHFHLLTTNFLTLLSRQSCIHQYSSYWPCFRYTMALVLNFHPPSLCPLCALFDFSIALAKVFSIHLPTSNARGYTDAILSSFLLVLLSRNPLAFLPNMCSNRVHPVLVSILVLYANSAAHIESTNACF